MRENRADSWKCEACTYVNWSRDKDCTECNTPKPVTAADLHEQLRPLRIEQTSDGTPKWPCPVCTYDNWPKTVRCVMCGTVPRVSPSATGADGAVSGSNMEENNMASVLKRYVK